MLHPAKCWYNTTMMKYRYELDAMSCIKEFGLEFVELGLSQVRHLLAGSTVKIKPWQICPYHCFGGTIKKTHQITHLGTIFAKSDNARLSQTPAISFEMNLHCRICEIFHSKCQNMHSGDRSTAQIGNMLHGNSHYGKCRAFNRICISKSYRLSMQM